MRNQALVYDLSTVTVSDHPVVIERNHYLVKPTYVYIGGLENYVVAGTGVLTKPVVLGHTGVARIIEAGVDSPQEYSGLLVVVAPTSNTYKGVVGYTINGLLARYSSVPFDTVFTSVSKEGVDNTILYYVAIASKINKIVNTNDVLIVGLGITGLAALNLLEKSREIGVVTTSRKMYGIARKYSSIVYKSLKEVKKCYNYVFINTLYTTLATESLDKLCSNGTIILNPIVAYINRSLYVPLSRLRNVNVVVAYPEKSMQDNVDKALGNILSEVRVIKPGSLKELLTLFPVKQPGIIIDLERI